MKWSVYYERYDGWQESTQYSRLSSITDFGPDTSPSSEITDCVQYVNEKTAIRIMKSALRSGVVFSGNEVADIVEYVIQDNEIIQQLINSSDADSYTTEDLERIISSFGDDAPVIPVINRICSKPNYFKDTDLVSLCESLSDDNSIENLLLTTETKFGKDTLDSLCDSGVDEAVIESLSRKSGIPYSDPYKEDDYGNTTNIASPNKKGLRLWGALAIVSGLFSGLSEINSSKRHPGRCDGNCAACPPHYGYRYGRWYYGHGHMHGCEFGGNRGGGSD